MVLFIHLDFVSMKEPRVYNYGHVSSRKGVGNVMLFVDKIIVSGGGWWSVLRQTFFDLIHDI